MTVLLLILVVSAVTSVGLCWAYMSNIRLARQTQTALQNDAARIQYQKAIYASIASDAVEYSKKHPELEPILESSHIIPPKAK